MRRATAQGGARVHRARRAVRTAAVAVTGLAAMGSAAACEPAECTTHYLTAMPVGAWDDPNVWTTGSVPTDTDIVCIGSGFAVEIPAGGAVTVKGLKTASIVALPNSSLTILNRQIEGAPTARFHLGTGSSITVGGGTGNLTLDGGELTGSGAVFGTVSGASSVSPGDPSGTGVGVLTIHGGLTLDAATVGIDVRGDGRVAGVGHDRVAVDGTVSVTPGTVVDVRADGTFAPTARTTISPMTASSRSGTPQVLHPDLSGPGTNLAVSFAGTGLELYVTECDPSAYGPYTTYTSSLAGKDLRLCELYTSTFSGTDLTGADLSEALLWDSTFPGANLTGVDLRRAEVGGADLSNATLTGLRSGSTQGVPLLPAGWSAIGGYLIGPGADLTGANLAGLDLTGVDLRGATLTGADLTGAELTGALLSGVRSGGVVGTPTSLPSFWELRSGFLAGPGANFTGANLAGVNLSLMNLVGADFTSANIAGANLNATLTRVRSGATTGNPSALPVGLQIRNGFIVGPNVDLSGKTLNLTNLASVNLSGAVFTDATLLGVNVTGSNWSAVQAVGIKGKNLQGFPSTMPPNLDVVSGFFLGPDVNLRGETLSGLNLASRPYRLDRSDLTNATIVGGDLFRLSLRNVNLTGATITNSTMDLVDMTGADMGGLAVGATFGSGLDFNSLPPAITLPTGWTLQATGLFGLPPYRLLRVS